jgi:hypothetical protein
MTTDPRSALRSVTIYFVGPTEDEALAGDAYYTAADASADAKALTLGGKPMTIYEVQAHFSVSALRVYEPDVCDECLSSPHRKGCSEF